MHSFLLRLSIKAYGNFCHVYREYMLVRKDSSILVVEDSISATSLLNATLARAGYQNRAHASTLEDALLALQARPHVVLLNPRIPERAETTQYLPLYAMAGRTIIEAIGEQQRLQVLGSLALIGMGRKDLEEEIGITEEWVASVAPDIRYTDLGLPRIRELPALLDAIDLEKDGSR